MIREFAVDPELFCQWDHHVVLRHAFSREQGRLISAFPRRWKGLIREVLDRVEENKQLTAMQLLAITEWLRCEPGTQDGRMTKCDAAYDGTKAWHLNAEDSYAAFEGILSHREFDAPNAIRADETHSYVTTSAFKAETQRTVQRRKRPIIDCVRPVLKGAAQIKVIEPHFDPNKERFRNVLEALLDRLSQDGSSVRAVELHIGDPSDADMSQDRPLRFTTAELHHRLLPLLRSGWTLRVHLWRRGKEKLHPRYLLTDLAGVQIDHGWDEGELESETTPIHLMSESRRSQEWRRYQEGTEDFTLGEIIVIE